MSTAIRICCLWFWNYKFNSHDPVYILIFLIFIKGVFVVLRRWLRLLVQLCVLVELRRQLSHRIRFFFARWSIMANSCMKTHLTLSTEGTTPWNMVSLYRVQTLNAPAEKDNNLHEEWHLKLIFEGHKNLDRRRESEINMYIPTKCQQSATKGQLKRRWSFFFALRLC